QGAAAANRVPGRGEPPSEAARSSAPIAGLDAAGAGGPGWAGAGGPGGAGAPAGDIAGAAGGLAGAASAGGAPSSVLGVDAQRVLSDLLARLQANVGGYAMPPMSVPGSVGAPL